LARWFGDDPESVVARELTRKWLNLVDPQGYAVAYAAFAGGDETYADRLERRGWSGPVPDGVR
jgi:hypothetical protein